MGNTIAIIPARGGSKGVPKKNVKLLAGLPLIAWSIKAAKNSGVIDRIFVSTDDKEIAEISKKYGAEIILEKEENLDQFDLTKEGYLQYAIEEIEKKGIKIEIVVFMQATSPFRNEKVIKEAILKLKKEKYDSVIGTFLEYGYFGQLINKEYVPFRKIRKRKQNMTPWYCDNGSLYIIKRDLFDQIRNRYGGKIGVVIMDKADSIQIDYPIDWWFAEQLVKYKNEKSL